MTRTGVLLTKKEAADRLRWSVRTVEKYIATGDIAVERVGGSVRIDEAVLNAFIYKSESSGDE
jgi:excisionase family DNA binding protein